MIRRNRALAGMLLGLCAMMGVAATPATGDEASRARATGARSPAATCAGEGWARPTSPLRDEAAAMARKSPLRIEVGADELARLGETPPGERRVRVGLTRSVEARVEFAGLRASDLSPTPSSLPIGSIRRIGAGGFLWTAAVESPGAAALRLRFSGFSLPRNAELFLYDDQGGSFGPYTGRGLHRDGQFWTHTLGGSKVVIQLHYRGEDTDRALRASRFVVSDIGHLTRAFPSALLETPEPDGRAGSGHCSFNASCIENARCAAVPLAVENGSDEPARPLSAPTTR